MINTKNSDYYVKSVVTLKVTTGFFAFSNLNICIAVVKENARREKCFLRWFVPKCRTDHFYVKGLHRFAEKLP